jgi:hypothetical protein
MYRDRILFNSVDSILTTCGALQKYLNEQQRGGWGVTVSYSLDPRNLKVFRTSHVDFLHPIPSASCIPIKV